MLLKRIGDVQKSLDSANNKVVALSGTMEYMKGQTDLALRYGAQTRAEEIKLIAREIGKANERINILSNAPKQSLKRRLAAVSRDILTFMVERKKNEPTLSFYAEQSREERDSQLSTMIAYSTATMNSYKQEFGSVVAFLVEQAGSEGVDLGTLRPLAEHPTNPLGVEILATRLGALALKLP